MAKYIIALCLMASAAIAEHWLIQLPITVVGTNTTVNIQNSVENHGDIHGIYIDISGNESAIFTNTLYASSSKGDRTLLANVTATAAASFWTNITEAIYDETIKLRVISPATATNAVTVNAVLIYEK